MLQNGGRLNPVEVPVPTPSQAARSPSSRPIVWSVEAALRIRPNQVASEEAVWSDLPNLDGKLLLKHGLSQARVYGHGSRTEEIYQQLVNRIVQLMPNKCDGVVICHGEAHTSTCTIEEILPKAVQQLLEICKTDPGYRLFLSFMAAHDGTKALDLLRGASEVKFLDGPEGRAICSKLCKKEVRSWTEALEALAEGKVAVQLHRASAPHTVVQLILEHQQRHVATLNCVNVAPTESETGSSPFSNVGPRTLIPGYLDPNPSPQRSRIENKQATRMGSLGLEMLFDVVKGGLVLHRGGGLNRVLSRFWSDKTNMAVIGILDPSDTNRTAATLKFVGAARRVPTAQSCQYARDATAAFIGGLGTIARQANSLFGLATALDENNQNYTTGSFPCATP